MKAETFHLTVKRYCGFYDDKNKDYVFFGYSNTNNIKITFYKVNGKGILLGDNIKLLDENFKEIKDISYLNEQFVNVTEVSKKYHKSNRQTTIAKNLNMSK